MDEKWEYFFVDDDNNDNSSNNNNNNNNNNNFVLTCGVNEVRANQKLSLSVKSRQG